MVIDMGVCSTTPIKEEKSTHKHDGKLEVTDMSGDVVLVTICQDYPDITSTKRYELRSQVRKLRIRATGHCTWELYKGNNKGKGWN